MTWLWRRWLWFFFAPVTSTNLAVCRLLFFGFVFIFYLPHDFSSWSDVSHVFFNPIALFRAFDLPVASRETLTVVQILWKLALGLSSIGLLTRASTWTSFILGTYLLGLAHNFGKTHSHDALLVVVMGILALARCGDSWSVDAWITRARRPRPSDGTPTKSGEYRWPIRAVWVVMALAFFAAAVSKLRISGLDWIWSDNLSIILLQNYYHRANADPLTSWGLYVAAHPGLTRAIAGATVAVEFTAPLALASRRARAILVPVLFLMLLGIRLAMGPSFEQFAFCFVFWVPWDRLRPACLARLRGASASRWITSIGRQSRSGEGRAACAWHGGDRALRGSRD